MIGNWLNNRKVRRKLESLKKKYVPLIREAEKAENLQHQAELTAQRAVEHESLLDPIYARNSAALISKALKYGIQVPRQEQGSKHYRRSGITGEFILKQLAQRRLRREVRNEERARNDEIRKWATATFALLGFVLALVSLLVKVMQALAFLLWEVKSPLQTVSREKLHREKIGSNKDQCLQRSRFLGNQLWQHAALSTLNRPFQKP